MSGQIEELEELTDSSSRGSRIWARVRNPQRQDEGPQNKQQAEGRKQAGMRERFTSSAPKAAHMVESLMNSSESEGVRLKAAQDILDRAGYQPTTRVEDVTEKKTVKELEAELISVVGQEKAEVLLGKKKVKEKPLPEKRLLN